MQRYLFVFIIYILIHGSYSKSTTIQNVPYQLSMEINGNPNCSATIISKDWALTTAFCLNGGKIKAEKVIFRAGSVERTKGGTIHHVSNIIIHNKYNSTSRDFDYALVQVKEPFDIGKPGVQHIPLASFEPVDKSLAVVSGWGVIDKTQKLEKNVIHSVEVPIVNRAICKGAYYGIALITKRNICAGYAEGGKDPCKGDLGGPLVYDGYQVGIVSKTFCGEPNHPGIYSNIPVQRTWIWNTSGV